MHTTCHADGSITYWSVYEQQWNSHAVTIPDQELAAMGGSERERVRRHMQQHGWRPDGKGVMHSPEYYSGQ